MKPSQDKGDVFEEKYRSYGEMLFKLSMVYLGNHTDAEEALQEAFIKLLYKAPEFADAEHEKRWLVRITINICKDKLKSYWRKNVVPMDEMQIYNENPEDYQLSELILKLPHKYRTAVHLHYYENYGVKELSRIFGISESSVKMRLKRGREFLKLELEENEYEKTGL
jgi:RNA polymerase sigma factor (sigma-70 family)